MMKFNAEMSQVSHVYPHCLCGVRWKTGFYVHNSAMNKLLLRHDQMPQIQGCGLCHEIHTEYSKQDLF